LVYLNILSCSAEHKYIKINFCSLLIKEYMSDTEAEENVPQAVKQIQKKIKPKRIMTEEQLNRLAKMREKAQEVRKKKYEERQTELSAKKEAELEEKQLAEQEKIIAKAERAKNIKQKLKQIEHSSDSDSPPTPPPRKVKKKTKKIVVPEYSSDSDTEIVIRKKTKKKPIKVVEEDDKELTPPLAPNDSTYDIDNKIKEKFEEYKRQSQDDEVLKLIRHMMPNYK